MKFTVNCPTSIHFGPGVSTSLTSLIGADCGAIALVRGSGGTASDPVARALKGTGASVLEIRVAGEPSLASVNAAFGACRESDITHVVACGGGSVIDTGKALAFCLSQDAELPGRFSDIPSDRLGTRHGVHLIALPTTAGTGAEVTSNAVLSVEADRTKTSLRGRALFPEIALVDLNLLSSAPKHVVLNAGLDAVVQTIEAYTSRLATPFSDALTEPNVRAGLQAVRRVVEGPSAEDWSRIAWVSLSSGLALANSGLGAAHGLAAVLGAELGAPHGALCGRLIAPVLAQNRRLSAKSTQISARIETCIQAISDQFPGGSDDDSFAGFDTWISENGLPRLQDYGATPDGLTAWAERGLSASSTSKNPVPLTADDLEVVLRNAL
ncbi:MAG: iron-containing alcohol dehydrogenase [Pseudomonadota bacterium]